MENSVKWRNISVILKFFYNDSVQGLFTRPFFRKRRNRYLLGMLFLVAYLFYFYLNMREFFHLSEGLGKNAVPKDVMLANTRILISSYTNFTLIFGVLLFVFVNSTVALNKNSLYFAKILPFSPREINWSRRIFNLSVALLFFELILIIVIPGLNLATMSVPVIFLFLVMLHILFVAIFLFLSLLHHAAIYITSFERRVLVSSCLDVLFFVIAIVHFTKTRFLIDEYAINQPWEIAPMVIVIVILSLVLLTLSLYVISKFADDATYRRTKFLHLGKLKSYGMSMSIPPIVRNKEFIYFTALAMIVSIITFTQSNFGEALQSLVFLIPLIGISAVSYADGTVQARTMYPLLRISPLYETGTVFFSAAVMMLPALAVGLTAVRSVDPYIFGICIFISAVIAGVLFPKSHSNLNETVSVTLTIVVIVLLAFILNLKGALYPAAVILAVILFSLLKKEYSRY